MTPDTVRKRVQQIRQTQTWNSAQPTTFVVVGPVPDEAKRAQLEAGIRLLGKCVMFRGQEMISDPIAGQRLVCHQPHAYTVTHASHVGMVQLAGLPGEFAPSLFEVVE